MTNFFNDAQQMALDWILAHGLPILSILLVALLAHKFIGRFIEAFIRKSVVRGKFSSATDEKKREDTLIHVFRSALEVILFAALALMILREAGFDTTPLLASAGIVGVAVGFGGQYLIKDIINGFFIVFENQYRVGDVICIGETCGLVENVNLRITTIRNLEGVVHYIPNNEIKIVSNYGKDFAKINMNIGVAYDADLKHVIDVVNDVGKRLASDPEWKDRILEAPKFLRVDSFGDSSINIKILAKTTPLEQWSIAGELRLRLKLAFDKEHIEIPFPQRVMRMAHEKKEPKQRKRTS